MRRTPSWLLALSLPLAVACSQRPVEAPSAKTVAKIESAEIQTALAGSGQQVTAQTSAALQRIAALRGQPPKVARKELVDFAKLEKLTPDALAGWTAEAPSGQRATFGPMQLSYAKRQYRKGDATLSLTLSDMSRNPSLAALPLTFSIEHEDDKGYEKPYNLGSLPGTLHWSKTGKTGQISVITDGQILIQVDGHAIADPQPLRELVAAVDLPKLAEVAK